MNDITCFGSRSIFYLTLHHPPKDVPIIRPRLHAPAFCFICCASSNVCKRGRRGQPRARRQGGSRCGGIDRKDARGRGRSRGLPGRGVGHNGTTYTYEAKVYEVGGRYGIKGGRISKLFIKERLSQKPVLRYDRGWKMRLQTASAKNLVTAMLAFYKA